MCSYRLFAKGALETGNCASYALPCVMLTMTLTVDVPLDITACFDSM